MHTRVEDLRPYNLPGLVHEAEKRLHDELNYRNEADNSEIFNALNPDQENVFAPKVINHLTTRRVLVTEWVDGVSPEDAKLSPEEGKALAQLGGQSVFRQIVVTGFFTRIRIRAIC